MKISARILKLERNELLTGPPTLMDRLTAEIDRMARRGEARVISEEFMRGLTDDEVAALLSELESSLFGNDTAAIEAARREARAAFDEVSA